MPCCRPSLSDALAVTSARRSIRPACAQNSAAECVLHSDEFAGASPAAPTLHFFNFRSGVNVSMEHRPAPGPSRDRAGDPSTARRVLLAEDDDDIRAVFEMVLKDYF